MVTKHLEKVSYAFEPLNSFRIKIEIEIIYRRSNTMSQMGKKSVD